MKTCDEKYFGCDALATPQKFSFAQGQANWPLPREEGCTMEMLWLISTKEGKKGLHDQLGVFGAEKQYWLIG